MLLASISIIPGLFFLINTIQLPKAVQKEVGQKNSFVELLPKRSLRKTFITSGIILTGVGLYEFYFPIYGKTLGLSASTIGVIVSCNALAYILSRLLMQWLLRKFKDETVLGACLTISSIAFFLIPLFEQSLFLMVISFIMGLGMGCCQPLSIVMAYNRSPRGRTGEVLGIRLTVINRFSFWFLFCLVQLDRCLDSFQYSGRMLSCYYLAVIRFLRRSQIHIKLLAKRNPYNSVRLKKGPPPFSASFFPFRLLEKQNPSIIHLDGFCLVFKSGHQIQAVS